MQLWSADRIGTAGRASLHIRVEDGTSHSIGDRVGINKTNPTYPFTAAWTIDNHSSTTFAISANTDLTASGTYYSQALRIDYFVNPNVDNAYNNAGYNRAMYIYSALRKDAGTLAELTGIYIDYGPYGASGADLTGTVTNLFGIKISGLKSASATVTNGYGLYILGSKGTTTCYDIFCGTTTAAVYFANNVGIAVPSNGFGTNATRTLGITSGVAPTSSPADIVQLYSADRGGTAGKAGLHIRSEDGTSHVFSDYVGLGTVSPSYCLHFLRSDSIATASRTVAYFQNTLNGTLGGSYNGTGLEIATHNNVTAGAYATTLTGFKSTMNNGGSYLATSLYGIVGNVYASHTSGTVGSAYGIYGYATFNGTGGTITAAYGGCFVVSLTAGTITTGYGIYIGSVAGTATWGLYQATASNNNFFAGNVGIGAGTFGTSAAQVLAIKNGTAPASSPSDTVQLYSADRNATAGKAGLHVRSEDGTSHVFSDYVGLNTAAPISRLHVHDNDYCSVNVTSNRKTATQTLGDLSFCGLNSADELVTYSSMVGRIYSPTDGAETGSFQFYTMIGGTLTQAFKIDVSNLSLGGASIGTSAAKVFAVATGTAPATAPADVAQFWAEDINGGAGKCGLHMMAESGTGKLIVAGVLIKTNTGDPTQVHEGLMCINTNDNNLKMYCEGGWRQLATW